MYRYSAATVDPDDFTPGVSRTFISSLARPDCQEAILSDL